MGPLLMQDMVDGHSISLDFHTSSNTAQCLPAREICNMNECIVKRGVDMSHTKNFLAFTNLGSKLNLDLFGLLLLSLTWSHFCYKIEEFGLTNKCLRQKNFKKPH